MSGSAVALNWANEHAAGHPRSLVSRRRRRNSHRPHLAGLNNPAGRLPVTFYASLDGLPAFTDYFMKNRTYRYYTGKPEWGFGYGLSYSTFTYSPVKLSSTKLKAGELLSYRQRHQLQRHRRRRSSRSLPQNSTSRRPDPLTGSLRARPSPSW
jgi:beta-glucosidase